MKYHVHADCDWVVGVLRRGHFEGELTEEQYQEYLALESDEERSEFIWDVCGLVLDDWDVDDSDDPTNIQITKIE